MRISHLWRSGLVALVATAALALRRPLTPSGSIS